MKVVILAGGYGTRLSEETTLIPKPMVAIGGKPILWHIMKCYSYYGFNDFIILSGYKSHVIKNFFVNYYQQYSDIAVDMRTNSVEILNMNTEPWQVLILYTGEGTLTGSRIKKAQPYIGQEPFLLTYGDGVSDVDIPASIACHERSGKLITMTVVRPLGRFGGVELAEDGTITSFREKDPSGQSWINGGFFVCDNAVFDYIGAGDNVTFEQEPLMHLARDGQLNGYRHYGFWHCMDTLHDKNTLTRMWYAHAAPWAAAWMAQIWRELDTAPAAEMPSP